MRTSNLLLTILFGLCVISLPGALQAGDWQAASIDDLGGLQNAGTEMKEPTTMELGRRDGADGHPKAWGEMEIDCGEHRSSKEHWCNIQLEIIFKKGFKKERVKIQLLDGEGEVIKTAYLLSPTKGDVRSRVYVIGTECVEGEAPTVRVAITGAKDTVKGNARVTFLRANCEKEDKTNWMIGSNWLLYKMNGTAYKRPIFLHGV